LFLQQSETSGVSELVINQPIEKLYSPSKHARQDNIQYKSNEIETIIIARSKMTVKICYIANLPVN